MILGLDGGWRVGWGISMEVVQKVGESLAELTADVGQPPCNLLGWDSHRVLQTTLTRLSLDILHNLFIITDSVVDLNLHWTQFIITSITFIRICLRNIIFLLVTNLMVVSHGGR